MTVVFKKFWHRLDSKAWFVTTTLTGILWPAYVATGGELPTIAPDVLSTVLWVLTGMAAVRLMLVAVILHLIHRDVKAAKSEVQ